MGNLDHEASNKAFEDYEMLNSMEPSERKSLLEVMGDERKRNLLRLIMEVRNAAKVSPDQAQFDFADTELDQAFEQVEPGEMEHRPAIEDIAKISDKTAADILAKLEEEGSKVKLIDAKKMAEVLNGSLKFGLKEDQINKILNEYKADHETIFSTSEWPSLRTSLEEKVKQGELDMNFPKINAAIAKAVTQVWQAEGNEGLPPVSLEV